MISKISKCRIVDSPEPPDPHEGQLVERTDNPNLRITTEADSVVARRRQLKATIVVGVLRRFLTFVEAEQARLHNEACVDLEAENADIADPFLKKNMQKRYKPDKKVSGYFYTAIAPVALPVRNMRDVAVTSKILLKLTREWVLEEARPPKSLRKCGTLQRSSIKKLSTGYKSTPRLSVDFALTSHDNMATPFDTPKPSIMRLPSKPAPLVRSSFANSSTLFPEKMIEAELNQFENLAKDVNQITHRNEVYEFVAVKYLVGSVLTNSAVLKADLLELESYERLMRKKEKSTLCDVIGKVQEALGGVNTIVIQHIRKRSRRFRRDSRDLKKEGLTTTLSSERLSSCMSSPPLSALRLLANSFTNLHKEFVLNCEKFFSHQCNRIIIKGPAYRSLLQLCTKARYGMMYLHREILFIMRKLNEQPPQPINPSLYDSFTWHVTQMTRILNDKYNMSSKRNRENGIRYESNSDNNREFYSEETSPNRKRNRDGDSSTGSYETKRLIKLYRNGDFSK